MLWTVKKLLTWISDDLSAKGITSSRLDAELLLAKTLNCSRVRVYMDSDRPVSEDERATLRALLARRREHEPMAYILGTKEFYGRDFQVNASVLIPRPDTERLVELALTQLKEMDLSSPRILDLCTGSGAIGLTLAAEYPEAQVVMSDISEAALAVASSNCESLGVSERAELLRSNLFEGLGDLEPFDMIVTNPPYIAPSAYMNLSREVQSYEPKLALVADAKGMSLIEQILDQAPQHMTQNAHLLMEIGYDQGDLVLAYAQRIFKSAGIEQDYGKRDRVLVASL